MARLSKNAFDRMDQEQQRCKKKSLLEINYSRFTGRLKFGIIYDLTPLLSSDDIEKYQRRRGSESDSSIISSVLHDIQRFDGKWWEVFEKVLLKHNYTNLYKKMNPWENDEMGGDPNASDSSTDGENNRFLADDLEEDRDGPPPVQAASNVVSHHDNSLQTDGEAQTPHPTVSANLCPESLAVARAAPTSGTTHLTVNAQTVNASFNIGVNNESSVRTKTETIRDLFPHDSTELALNSLTEREVTQNQHAQAQCDPSAPAACDCENEDHSNCPPIENRERFETEPNENEARENRVPSEGEEYPRTSDSWHPSPLDHHAHQTKVKEAATSSKQPVAMYHTDEREAPNPGLGGERTDSFNQTELKLLQNNTSRLQGTHNLRTFEERSKNGQETGDKNILVDGAEEDSKLANHTKGKTTEISEMQSIQTHKKENCQTAKYGSSFFSYISELGGILMNQG